MAFSPKIDSLSKFLTANEDIGHHIFKWLSVMDLKNVSQTSQETRGVVGKWCQSQLDKKGHVPCVMSIMFDKMLPGNIAFFLVLLRADQAHDYLELVFYEDPERFGELAVEVMFETKRAGQSLESFFVFVTETLYRYCDLGREMKEQVIETIWSHFTFKMRRAAQKLSVDPVEGKREKNEVINMMRSFGHFVIRKSFNFPVQDEEMEIDPNEDCRDE